MAESSPDIDAVETEDQEPQSTLWVPPATSPLTVVAHRVRMRYKAPRTDRSPRKGLWGRISPRKSMVSVSAVRGIDLTVREGEFVGIIGRNGSGKSTLLRMLAGVEPPTSGSIFTSSRPQLLGVSAALMSDLTGAENIKLGFLALGMTPAQAEELLPGAAELSALGDAVDLPMRTYSSGMASRLKFAISVMAQPKILMVDEALSTGDATFSKRSKAKMDELLENAGTVFMVNHAPRAIETVCSRVIWMEKGRVVMDGDTTQVCSTYRSFTYRMARDREVEAMEILREAVLAGEPQRASAALTLPQDEEPTPSDRTPELEPDPFASIFTRRMEAQRFPGTRRLDD
ncbi:ABC transporter ATP-binding protein [Brachybacterium saurashtrense]|uniref:ABC transporter ATP-binding protein n=1 Tax=Brachybacterium saurashtrense TaxID=556288 RepID=A0A345YQK0_9MICO|nr:ABC transporter ATP-binding protein [Brachybacterium saurashtrense]AXK46202.1 ABC transporter ATP-binding protein [Brachybacterium saurashtrense]RRR23942.1 ABC transporter ATP-binding protein [Brachybacterium saurashtrense]